MIFRYLNIKTCFVAALLVIVFTGCIDDKCTAILCKNEGVCVDGSCACAYAYEGDSCEKQWYEKFAGKWTAVEKDKAGVIQSQYEVNAIYGLSADSFFILGFADIPDTVICTRKAYNTFTLLPRKRAGGDSLQGGEAIFYDETNKVTGLYSFANAGVTTNVSFTWSR